MIQIRNNVFETNSSSMHSVSINENNNIFDTNLEIEDNKVVGHFDEFGWGYDCYNDTQTKLSYLLTMIAGVVNSIDDLYSSDDFIKIEECIKHYINCDGISIAEDEYRIKQDRDGETYLDFDGYIDHQSQYFTIRDFLYENGVELEEFLFNSKVELIIDNDNH